MADDERSGDQECMACRGTGRVISTLGGEPRTVDCPWCEGTGRRIPGHDAQARWRGEGGNQPGGDQPGGDRPAGDEPPAAA